MMQISNKIDVQETKSWGRSYHNGFVTESIELVTQSGKRISAYLDAPTGLPPSTGLVLVAPAYGETKENNVLISAYFVANGFYAVRFDWTEHVGESEGDIFTCTLSKMMDDILGLVRYQKTAWPVAKLGIVTSSLAGRVALKAAAQDDGIDFLAFLAPVVDLRYTLRTTYQEDLVGNYKKGKRYGTLDVLGFNIDADSFLRDAVQNSFCDLQSSITDAAYIKTPTFICVGERDSWVRVDDAREFFMAIPASQKDFFAMPVALHRLIENPAAIKATLKRAVYFSKLGIGDVPIEAVREPVAGEVHSREVAEKSHLKEKYDYSKEEEREFWKGYLSRFKYIYNIHDYWNLLETIYESLGGAWSGQRILDAGCGNGNYGFFLLLKQTYKSRQSPQLLGMPPCYYYGTDFVWEAISEADCRISELQSTLLKQMGVAAGRELLFQKHFILADLENGVPVPDGFFDQICCNLVLSYLQKPEKALAELHRVLRPGGKVIITSLKPNPDLSEVYRNFVAVAQTDEEVTEARNLLSNASAIKVKEVRGLYHFYSEKELKRLVRRCGLRQVRVLRSFGNQANVVIGRKLSI
jgi:SAM-dependent methyltransferase/alpha-beta hydrolase superfamily lysophospholipase